VSDDERENIVNFVKSSCEAAYSEDVIDQIEKASQDKGGSAKTEANTESKSSDYDELLSQAVDVIFDTKQASVSMLQRRLKLGYARAARLVDQMEEIGVVGPFEGSKPRQILMTREQWLQRQSGDTEAPQQPQQLPTDQTMFTADDLFTQDDGE
jgi:S-DNA-T family DNA segregation ATPase FtsK/SpoIIIE